MPITCQKRMLIPPGLVAILTLCGFAGNVEPRSSAAGSLTGATGTVSVDGVPAPAGTTLFAGDVVTTGTNSRAVIGLKAGGFVVLKQFTEMTMPESQPGASDVGLRHGTLTVRTSGIEPIRVRLVSDEVSVEPQGVSSALCTVALLGSTRMVVPHRGRSAIHGSGDPLLLFPGDSAQVGAGYPQGSGSRAGIVTAAVPEGRVQRSGPELTLGVNDPVHWGDVVRTLKTGRVEIQMADGGTIRIGSSGHCTFSKSNQVENCVQYVRAIKPPANSLFSTLTALIRTRGTDFVVDAQPDETAVYVKDGEVLVSNIDPKVIGEVTLPAGYFTIARRGLPPTAAASISGSISRAEQRAERATDPSQPPPPSLGMSLEWPASAPPPPRPFWRGSASRTSAVTASNNLLSLRTPPLRRRPQPPARRRLRPKRPLITLISSAAP